MTCLVKKQPRAIQVTAMQRQYVYPPSVHSASTSKHLSVHDNWCMLRSSSIYSPRLHLVPRLTDQQPASLCGSTPARVRVLIAPPTPTFWPVKRRPHPRKCESCRHHKFHLHRQQQQL
ncbi:uncharacterized protein LOC142774763 [Rhipicephalus microplus]|uniref:uncharacterized protein LOC142774763 n=1 Tax=Rhipicephalus microplus TaxID=6941 RepID=UPI003F6BF8BC